MQTTNGAVSLATSADARLDLFFKTVRNANCLFDTHDNANLHTLIDASWRVDPLDTMKILFNWRDCRGGKGDHDGFIVAMAYIERTYPEWFDANIAVIPEYGSYLDWVKLWHMVSCDGKITIMNLIVKQLCEDMGSSPISLLAKWIPSENSKWDRWGSTKEKPKDRFLHGLCREMFGVQNVNKRSLRDLRVNYITPLRRDLKLVESRLCERKYDQIDYEKVPGVAMNKYKKAFQRNDPIRFKEYLHDVHTGKAGIKAGQMYPHDLVRQYMSCDKEDPVIEAQWAELKRQTLETGAFDDSVIVCDVSGSMNGTPMEVAIALGILGMNNNRLITFSEFPELHYVPDGLLYTQVQNVMGMNWGGSTNFQSVMNLVLGMCVTGSAIKRVFVFSDMQFDVAFSDPCATNFEAMRAKFSTANLELPQIVFWNLRGQTGDFPVCCNEHGVVMLSGFSPSLLKGVLSGKEMTPLGVMLEIIHSPRYDRVIMKE